MSWLLRAMLRSRQYTMPLLVIEPDPLVNSRLRSKVYSQLWRRLVTYPRQVAERVAELKSTDSEDGSTLYQIGDAPGSHLFGNYSTIPVENTTVHRIDPDGQANDMTIVDTLIASTGLVLDVKGTHKHTILVRVSWNKHTTRHPQIAGTVSKLADLWQDPEEIRCFLQKLDEVIPLRVFNGDESEMRSVDSWYSCDTADNSKIGWLFNQFKSVKF